MTAGVSFLFCGWIIMELSGNVGESRKTSNFGAGDSRGNLAFDLSSQGALIIKQPAVMQPCHTIPGNLSC